MPVATSSRRKTNGRRPNSEDIENSRPTQANDAMEDVSDDGRTRRSNVKQEKRGKGKQRAEPTNEPAEENPAGDDDDDEDDNERIDVSNFEDQPLRRDDGHKLRAIAGDWERMVNTIEQRSDLFKDIAVAYAEAGEQDTTESNRLKKLDGKMKEFLSLNAEMTSHSDALKAIHQQIATGVEVTDIIERYERVVGEKHEQWLVKTTRQKYARNDKYIDFQTGIWEVHHPEDPMPPLTELITKEDGDDSDDDDDLEIGGVVQNFTCPLTLVPLTNPVTSKICKHSFSADAIKDMCKVSGKLYNCPASGCTKKFKLSDCVPDPALEKKTKAYLRRKEAAQQDSDAEEVID
ncbi:hypothetical protein BJ165DRAFT_1158733 [Panaeolus papilionaceus]|nr:hypothetical protein BJ165DRAFT_1158733 [Panaeolus papilionaceus]